MNLENLVDEYLKVLKNDINAFILLPNCVEQSRLILNLKDVFETKFDIEFSWLEISKKLSEIATSILVIEVHQKSKKPLNYNTGERVNVIAVGGLSLSRGFTLEGLSVSYFIRSTILCRWVDGSGTDKVMRICVKFICQKRFKTILDLLLRLQMSLCINLKRWRKMV